MVVPKSLLLSSGLQSISWAVHVLVHFCFAWQLWAKCPCSLQLKHTPCVPLWTWTSSVLATFPLDEPLPRPLQFPLGTLVLSRSIGTGWLFHDFCHRVACLGAREPLERRNEHIWPPGLVEQSRPGVGKILFGLWLILVACILDSQHSWLAAQSVVREVSVSKGS